MQFANCLPSKHVLLKFRNNLTNIQANKKLCANTQDHAVSNDCFCLVSSVNNGTLSMIYSSSLLRKHHPIQNKHRKSTTVLAQHPAIQYNTSHH
jgi:regulator of sigma D